MNKYDNIEYEKIFRFLSQYNNTDFGLKDLEEYAKINKIPIIKKDVALFLYFIISIFNPKKILEIGTAIGYSSILMSKASNYKSEIYTIEKNENMANIALCNIKKYSPNNINLKVGDALDVIDNIDDKFDFIFIDASKSHYKSFFEKCKKNFSEKYLIVADNILAKGLVCLDINEIPKRQKTIYKNMNDFIENIFYDDSFLATIIPIGDGLLMIKENMR